MTKRSRTVRIPKKKLVDFGKEVDKAYEDADRPIGLALGRNLRPSKPMEEVNVDVGRAIWRSASALRGVSIPEPSVDVLRKIGRKATRFLEDADCGRVWGKVEDVYLSIGVRSMSDFDAEVERLTAVAGVEASVSPAMSGP